MAPRDEVALYRRWRPQRFSEVVGQRLVVDTLRRAVARGRLSHAYLFAGQRGVGKTTVARILARAANCLAPEDGEPCNRCENCLRILEGKSLDMVEIDGASNRGIDQIRRLREEVNYVPAGARYKVYIIDEVHMLTNEAFNALLKTLEEPPPHVIFIFATTEPHKVPPTILSRCQVFEFHPIPEELIAKRIREIAEAEGIELEEGAAALIARRAEGSLRDAEVLLEQLAQGGAVREEDVVELLGLPPREEVDRFLGALRARDAREALEAVRRNLERGRDLALFLEEAAHRARDLIVAGEDLVELARRLFSWRAELPRTVSPRLHLELEILDWCGAPPAKPPPAPAGVAAGAGGPEEAVPGEPASPPEDAPDAEGLFGGEAPAPGDDDGGVGWPSPEDFRDPWDKVIASALAEGRVAVAAFLHPAEVDFRDGVLTLLFPEGYRFHYEMARELETRRYIEELARRFFSPLLSVRIEYAGGVESGLSLEEGAEIIARHLEGKVVRDR